MASFSSSAVSYRSSRFFFRFERRPREALRAPGRERLHGGRPDGAARRPRSLCRHTAVGPRSGRTRRRQSARSARRSMSSVRACSGAMKLILPLMCPVVVSAARRSFRLRDAEVDELGDTVPRHEGCSAADVVVHQAEWAAVLRARARRGARAYIREHRKIARTGRGLACLFGAIPGARRASRPRPAPSPRRANAGPRRPPRSASRSGAECARPCARLVEQHVLEALLAGAPRPHDLMATSRSKPPVRRCARHTEAKPPPPMTRPARTGEPIAGNEAVFQNITVPGAILPIDPGRQPRRQPVPMPQRNSTTAHVKSACESRDGTRRSMRQRR
jgi:hypothetical protein